MASDSLSKLLFLLVAVLSFVNLGVKSQSAPCTTPLKKQGLCVAINRCQNLYRIVTSPKPASTRMATYIEQAACTLPNVKRSICCQPSQVVVEEGEELTPSATQHSKVDLLPEECGLAPNDHIREGNLTHVFAYPWMAVLQYDNNGDLDDRCGGSLISKRYVLTAGRCLKRRSPFRLVSVRLGEHTKNQEEDCNIYLDTNGKEVDRECAGPPEDYEIDSFVVHPDYNRPRFNNDIGLIRLKKDVVMQDHIKPICLPVTPELRALQLDKFLVIGWGVTEDETGSNVLMEAVMPRMDNAKCQQMFNQIGFNIKLGDKQICAGGRDDIDACCGDSGGPIGFVARNNYGNARFFQFGVVASGVVCFWKSLPGIYTRVSSHMDWILDNMKP